MLCVLGATLLPEMSPGAGAPGWLCALAELAAAEKWLCVPGFHHLVPLSAGGVAPGLA